MIARLGILLLAGLLAAAAPPPPPVLAPYFHGDAFDPGDYGWLRGRFPDATAADKATMAAVDGWLASCQRDGEERIRAELAALGVADARIELQPYPGTACAAFWSAGLFETRRWPTFAAFSADVQKARPIADTFVWATDLAVAKAGPRGPTLADQLNAWPLGEQMLRTALSWGQGAAASAPAIDAGVRAVVEARLWAAIARADHTNTEYLKRVVAAQGWPDLRTVGVDAAGNAWLLAQHADADPAFQLKVLRMMEPLLASGGVRRQDYALLYDRVMLKLTGRQRYGTQMHCSAGNFVPRPLESEADLARRRAEMGLETMADYVKVMEAGYGRCRADAH